MADDKQVEKYCGREADVTWDRTLCLHVGECGRAEGPLFEGDREPWCQPDLVSVRDVVRVVERCPSGALAYERKDAGGAEEVPAPQNTMQVSPHGPLYLRGDLLVVGHEDRPGIDRRVALCRCGASKNKPFCDNSHEAANFEDYGAVGERGQDTLPQGGGTLKVEAAPKGPLLLKGNLQIVASSGRVAWRGTKTALCRCGASGNKPFCDGSHKDVGFDAE